MVFFTCSQCGEAMKKNQVDKHYQRQCFNCSMVSCVDCQKEFWGNDYQSHTQCISEAEKYSGKNYQPKANANKGQVKQDKWIQQVQEAINKVKTNPRLRDVLERIKEYPNIPRKKAKFENFLKNSIKIRDSSLASQAWDAVSAEMTKVNAQNSGNEETQKAENKDQKENKKVELEEQEVEETEAEQKLSKREKKEARKRKMNKEEKKDKKINGVPSEEINEQAKKGKKKKKKLNDEEESLEEETKTKKSKKKKKNKEEGSSEDGQESEETKQQHHSGKKRKRKLDDDDGPEVKQCRLNDTLEVADDTTQGKFDWEATIIGVLEGRSEKEIPVKKLRKKVLAEFNSRGGDKKTSEEKLLAKFNKKIKKNPRLKVLKDRVKLVS